VTLSTHAAPDSFVCGYWNADIGPVCRTFNLIKKKSSIDQKRCKSAFALCNAGSARSVWRDALALPMTLVFLGESCAGLPHRCSVLMCLAANATQTGVGAVGGQFALTSSVDSAARLCRTLRASETCEVASAPLVTALQ